MYPLFQKGNEKDTHLIFNGVIHPCFNFDFDKTGIKDESCHPTCTLNIYVGLYSSNWMPDLKLKPATQRTN